MIDLPSRSNTLEDEPVVAAPRRPLAVAVVCLFAALLASCSNFLGDENEHSISDYLPLDVGNMWAYQSVETTDRGERWVDTVRVFGIAEIDGIEYALYDSESRPWYLRSGEPNRVMQLLPGGWSAQEVPWLLFDLEDGATYHYPGSNWEGYTVTVSRGLQVETPSGVFHDCIRFDFYSESPFRDAFSYTFAPGVGMVAYETGHPRHYVLTGLKQNN
jgi:hypothetical protein